MFDGYFFLFDFTPLTPAPYQVYIKTLLRDIYDGSLKNILFKILLMRVLEESKEKKTYKP